MRPTGLPESNGQAHDLRAARASAPLDRHGARLPGNSTNQEVTRGYHRARRPFVAGCLSRVPAARQFAVSVNGEKLAAFEPCAEPAVHSELPSESSQYSGQRIGWRHGEHRGGGRP